MCQFSAVLPGIAENIIAKQDTVLDCNKLSFLKGNEINIDDNTH